MADKRLTLLQKLLRAFSACERSRQWASRQRSLASAWEACPNVGWLMWALDRLGLQDALKDDAWYWWIGRRVRLPTYEERAARYRKLYGNPFKDRKALARLRRLV